MLPVISSTSNGRSRYGTPLGFGLGSSAISAVSRVGAGAPTLRCDTEGHWPSCAARWLLWFFVFFHTAFVIPSAHAHPSDISYLRVKLERQRVEMRFTFNVLTLTRFVPGIDANQDKQIDKAELDAAKPLLLSYLNEHIEVEVNGHEAILGEMQPFECVWPTVEGKQSAAEMDYPVRYVDILFTQPVKPLLADVWLSFEIWPQTGPLGSIEATFEQGDLRTQVPFTMNEPDYLYDTGYAVEEIFQEEKKSPPTKNNPYPTWILPWVEAGLALILIGSLFQFIFAPRKKQ